MSDFDKVRVYRCLCGSAVVRPLRGEPKVCDHCQGDLRYVPYQVEDHKRFVERLLSGAEPHPEGDGP
jgi:hypothetical protein